MTWDTADEDGSGDDDRWLLDMIPVVAVAVLLVGVHRLPASIKRELVFEYSTPTISTAYTAHFVHFSVTHLFSNLAAFVLVTGTIYALSVKADWRQIYFAFGAILLIAFPISLSVLNLAVPRDGVTYGFSGLNMALVGFLPVVIATYVERRLGYTVDGTVLLTVFVASVGYIAVIALPQFRGPYTLGIVAAIVVVGLWWQYRSVRGDRSLAVGRVGTDEEARILVAVALLVWGVLLSVGFPETVADGGTVTNIYVHFLGYALGFMTAYLGREWHLVGDRPAATVVSTARSETNRKP